MNRSVIALFSGSCVDSPKMALSPGGEIEGKTKNGYGFVLRLRRGKPGCIVVGVGSTCPAITDGDGGFPLTYQTR